MTVPPAIPRYSVRDRRWISDAAFTAVAGVASLASVFYIAELAGWPTALELHVVPPVAIAFRRYAPAAAAAVVLALDVVQWLLRLPYSGAQISTLIALYTVTRICSPRTSLTVLAATITVVLASPLRQTFANVWSTVFALATVVLIYVLARNVELRAAYLRGLEDHTRRLEQDHNAAIEAATAQERARIAREMHDVVAHHVSVMVVGAEGASWAINDDADAARSAMTSVADTGRSALGELRRLLGVLRDDATATVQPQPGVADIPDLVDRFCGSGVLAHYAPTGTLSDLPASLEVTIYRVVQESLTNVLKHASPGACAEVTLDVDTAAVRISVTDNGAAPSVAVAEPGHGLLGVRERVATFGGTVNAGPRERGGFAVSAVIPRG